MVHFRLAVFTLNQWALDYESNYQRIIKSIELAKAAGSFYRVGPELEICGYSCEDSFFERDHQDHCWQIISKIINNKASADILIDVGMPVSLNSARYNCRIIIYNGHILLIRPKTRLAINGNYRESRHFTAWDHRSGMAWFKLPPIVTELHGQKWAPFGSGAILEFPIVQQDRPSSSGTFRIGHEICQEMWDSDSLNEEFYSKYGCHLIVNSSASYWELRKLDIVQSIMKAATLRSGGVYAFSNLLGCDGQRICFYGRSCIFVNGELTKMTNLNGNVLTEVDMITHDIDHYVVEDYRSQYSVRIDSNKTVGSTLDLMDCVVYDQRKNLIDIVNTKVLHLNVNLQSRDSYCSSKDPLIQHGILRFEEEIYLYASLWMWDYLRRSRMKGFVIPLSGGLDSSSVACLVYSMCVMVHDQMKKGSDLVFEYFQRAHNVEKDDMPNIFKTPSDICKSILSCYYLATKFSGAATQRRADKLCSSIGCEFHYLNFDQTFIDMKASLDATISPKPSVEAVKLLDQNLQARLRMTSIYYLSGGNRIVLATGNVDEALMGYLTKYDCSSADINPIGGICKRDLCCFMSYCSDVRFKDNESFANIVHEIVEAPPSAELTGEDQRDEDEIGLTYDEIAAMGRLRRGQYACCGPYMMFKVLWQRRNDDDLKSRIRGLGMDANPEDIGEKVKRFFKRYARNRHKQTVLTPALHAETYSPDDNRFDHRQFLFNSDWTLQFSCIDEEIARIKSHN